MLCHNVYLVSGLHRSRQTCQMTNKIVFKVAARSVCVCVCSGGFLLGGGGGGGQGCTPFLSESTLSGQQAIGSNYYPGKLWNPLPNFLATCSSNTAVSCSSPLRDTSVITDSLATIRQIDGHRVVHF